MTAYPDRDCAEVADPAHPAHAAVLRRLAKWGFDLDVPGEGCWVSPKKPNQYGYVRVNLQARGAGLPFLHRAVWALANGRPIPAGHQVDHTCRTKACCNPRHLDAVPAAVNGGKDSPYAWTTGTDGTPRCQRGHDVSDPYIHPSGRRICRECVREGERHRTARGRRPLGILRGWALIDAATPHPTLAYAGSPCLVLARRGPDGRAGRVTVGGRQRSATVYVLMRRDGLSEPPLCDDGHQMAADHLCEGAREGCVNERHLRWLDGRTNDAWAKDRTDLPKTAATVEQVVAWLDALDVDPALGKRPAGRLLRVAGHRADHHTITAAQRARRARAAQEEAA